MCLGSQVSGVLVTSACTERPPGLCSEQGPGSRRDVQVAGPGGRTGGVGRTGMGRHAAAPRFSRSHLLCRAELDQLFLSRQAQVSSGL